MHHLLWEGARHVILDLQNGQRATYDGQVAFSPKGAKFTVGGSWGLWGSDRLEIRDSVSRRVEFALALPGLLGLAKSQDACALHPSFQSEPVAVSEVRWLSDDVVEFRLMCMDATGNWIKLPHRVAKTTSGWRVVGVGQDGG